MITAAVGAARRQIVERFGQEYLPAEARTYRTKVKNAQEAHEAIRPAGDDMRLPDDVGGELASSDERRLYDLVWKRTVASQMTDESDYLMYARMVVVDAIVVHFLTHHAGPLSATFPARLKDNLLRGFNV